MSLCNVKEVRTSKMLDKQLRTGKIFAYIYMVLINLGDKD